MSWLFPIVSGPMTTSCSVYWEVRAVRQVRAVQQFHGRPGILPTSTP
jgi:hypothetical protein